MGIKDTVKRIMFAAKVMVKPYSPNVFRNIKIPMEHRAPEENYEDDQEWKDTEYNYRLGAPVEEIYYAFTGGEVIGHLGLNADTKVTALYVSPEYRRKGVATKMYEEVFSRNSEVFSDDPDAMEPEAKATWEKLMKKMPDKIKKLKDGSFVYQG